MPGPGVVGVLHLVSEPTLVVTWTCASQRRMHVARRGTCDDTERMPRGDFPVLGLSDEDIDLLAGDECDILV
jgi:hypothetical protein